MASVIGTRKTQYHPRNPTQRMEELRKEKARAKDKSIDWDKIVKESLNVLMQFKKHFADPKNRASSMLKAKCPRKGCGGMVWARTSGPPKHHIHFACTNTSSKQGGTGECFIQGME
jgi:hypothetical protein